MLKTGFQISSAKFFDILHKKRFWTEADFTHSGET